MPDTPVSQTFSDAELAQYGEHGFFLVRSLFTPDEIAKLLAFSGDDDALHADAMGRKDATGAETKLKLFNFVGDDLYSMFARSPRIVRRIEQLLGGEVYHYHSKMNMKQPRVGGAWEWHQDYGYWYNNGCLRPLLASCMIAVTPSTRENGCLQVIQGSHQCGRIDHGKTGDQTGADMERVEQALKIMDLLYVESNPGDALFFHGNLLHRSDQNRSDQPRWSLICCYNARRNSPYKEGKHPQYIPLETVADDAILNWEPSQ